MQHIYRAIHLSALIVLGFRFPCVFAIAFLDHIYICRHIFCSSQPLSLSRSHFLYTGLYRFMSPYIYICIYTYIVHSILSSCLRMYVWAELSLRGLDAAEQQNSCAISVHTSGSLSTFHGGWRQGLVCGHNRRNLSSLACYTACTEHEDFTRHHTAAANVIRKCQV